MRLLIQQHLRKNATLIQRVPVVTPLGTSCCSVSSTSTLSLQVYSISNRFQTLLVNILHLILCKKSQEYNPAGNFRSWAFNIARYQVLAHLTKKRRSKVCFSNELTEALASEDFDIQRHQLTQRALQICYDLLPDHMREIAKMRFKEDAPMKEICKILNRPIGAISGTLFRIRQNLIKCVQLKIPQLEIEEES